MKKILFTIILCSQATAFSGDLYKDFPGQYDIGGKTILDASEGEPRNTHIYFRIMGDAAKEMYSIIESEAVYDICIDDGTMTKSAGNIKCDFTPKENSYICYFGVGINENSIDLGAVC